VQLRHINRSGPAFSKHTVNFCLAAGSHFANLSQPILCSVLTAGRLTDEALDEPEVACL